MVFISNLWKIFPSGVVALRDINIEISPGEFFVILGPSGSGKTTLLRILAGLEIPTRGGIAIGDKEIVDVEKGVFVEPRDNWALYPHMTAYENIAFPLKLKGLPKEEIGRRVRDVASALGITELLQRRPSQMSGGQQQRVALARALVKQPDVLLLDEPFSNLDAAREFVKELQRRLGITTILVTHDQADAFAVGDRVMVMKDGMIQQIGSPEELYNKPENIFVASFIGDPPMNIYKLPIDHPMAKKLELSVDEDYKEIFIGVRPDDAIAVDHEEEGHLGGRVAIVEYVGSRKYVKIDLEDGVSLKTLAEQRINQGYSVKVRIKKLHIFAPDGKRIETLTQ